MPATWRPAWRGIRSCAKSWISSTQPAGARRTRPPGEEGRSSLPATTAVDTSVLVAALLAWHEAHDIAREALDEALTAGALVLPVHALLETYSVLTRLPAPHRLSPVDAHSLLSELKTRTVISGLGEEAWALLQDLASRNIAGGSTYDAAIMTEAAAAGAASILTLDRGDFERIGLEGIAIRIL